MSLPPPRAPYKQLGGRASRNTTSNMSAASVTGVFTHAADGETSFTTAGTFSFVVPKNVCYISAVCIGYGGSVASSLGGAGGGLAWRNRIPVTPGETLTVVIQAIGKTAIIRGNSTSGEILCGATSATIAGPGYPIVGQGGSGGPGVNKGGGGAGGYMGGGGPSGTSATGGGGGGGGPNSSEAGGGGGTGLVGLDPSFTFAAGSTGISGGGAGAGGTTGGSGSCCTTPTGCPPVCTTSFFGGNGGNYGGGAGFGACFNGVAASGAVRIIWPGETRHYPYGAA